MPATGWLYIRGCTVLLLAFLVPGCGVWAQNAVGKCPTPSDIESCGPGHYCVKVKPLISACLCQPGYAPTGPSDSKCQMVNVCDAGITLCFNGGNCQQDTSGPMRYKCTCQPNFAGTNCERNQNVCDVVQRCVNDGTCIVAADKPNGYFCLCPSGYTGETCAYPVSIGVGGGGVALSPVALIVLWGLWIAMAMTFLYCSVTLLIGWWASRFRKTVTGGA